MNEGTKAKVINDWIVCPLCNKKLLKVEEDTKFYNLTLYCRRCRKEIGNLSFHGYPSFSEYSKEGVISINTDIYQNFRI